MIERKCLSCGTWNKAEDYCTNCGNALSPKAIDKEKELKHKAEKAEEKPSKMDIYLHKAKTSKYMVVRWAFYFMYSIFMLVGLFAAMMAWMAALANA